MGILEAILLGLVQGVTEVLPISSSGHLVLMPWFFEFTDPGLSFNVALHLGTLAAIIYYFRFDWIRITKGFLTIITERNLDTTERKLSLFILLATIPGAIAGAILNDYAETTFRNPILIAATTIIFGFVLLLVEKVGSQKRALSSMKTTDSIKIGLAQAVAIIPGVSRSGITVSAGMLGGFTRESAAKFSFLISAPIILGAGLFEFKDMIGGDFSLGFFLAGFFSSFVASFLSVRFLMSFVKTHKLNIFAYYRFGLAALIIILYLTRS